MKSLFILGAGRYGQVVKEIALATGEYRKIEFLDDDSPLAIGTLSQIFTMNYDEAIVAIGNPVVRKEWTEKIERLATLVHPKAVVSPSAKLGEGCIIEGGAVLSANTTIGRGVLVMANAVVGHDATVGAYCKLKYNSTLYEGSVLPDFSQLECNAVYGRRE